jgi:hypothetical protein
VRGRWCPRSDEYGGVTPSLKVKKQKEEGLHMRCVREGRGEEQKEGQKHTTAGIR